MKYLKQYCWSILWGILMLALMLAPSKDLDAAPSFPGFDKLAHCGTFFVLTTLLYWESSVKHNYQLRKWVAILKIVLCTVIFAGATELAQRYFSPSRTADWWDFFADLVGIGMASFAFLLLFKKRTT